jgi:ABC-type glycerol-3-phosphate transport system substrate-binding protein
MARTGWRVAAATISALLRSNAQKLPPERKLPVDLVIVEMGAGKVNRTPAELADSYAAAHASGAIEADLVFADHSVPRGLAKASALRDLGPILDTEPWFNRDNFWSNILQTVQIRGTQLGLPMDASVEVVSFNQSSMKKVGIDVPTT